MRSRYIGRALGIGVRVAGRIAGQRLAAQSSVAGSSQSRTLQAGNGSIQNRGTGQVAGRIAGQAGRSVSRGVGGFLRPFRRVGGILWFEVTGVLFLLPVLVFAPALWHAGIDYPHTSDHKTFWIAAGVVAIFLYLSVSSFWRAHRRSRATLGS